MPGFFLIPTAERVADACKEFDGKYCVLEGALDELFRRYPQNTDPRHVLLKVVTLNRLYAAGVLAVEALALHIHGRGEEIDSGLAIGAPSIVDTIAKATIQGKEFRFFSFATKYCNWHQPSFYPVYDSRVDRYLWSLQKHKKFSDFFELRSDLCKDGAKFLKIMTDFRGLYGLEAFSFKEIDKFLWLRGESPTDLEGPMNAEKLQAEPRAELDGIVSDGFEHASTVRDEAASALAVETAAEFFKRRAEGSGKGLQCYLDKIPDVPPDPGDELPDGLKPQ